MQRTTILLDRGRLLNTLRVDLILIRRWIRAAATVDRGCCREDTFARLTNYLTQRETFMILSCCDPRPLIVLLALALSGCGDKAPPPAAATPAPVTVAQPVKRTVTDWDEFTGRFEAVEEVQVRARVGGCVNSIECRDGAFVKAGDLLYVIDARPFEAVAEQAEGQLADARAKAELGKRELDRALTLNQTQAVADSIVDQRRQT